MEIYQYLVLFFLSTHILNGFYTQNLLIWSSFIEHPCTCEVMKCGIIFLNTQVLNRGL